MRWWFLKFCLSLLLRKSNASFYFASLSVSLMGGWGGGGVGEGAHEAQLYDRKKAWASIKRSILSAGNYTRINVG
jgi:hypothetical protein